MYKAVCVDDSNSDVLVKGEHYWIRFSGPLYAYVTCLHILSDRAHFGMFQASRFEIIESEESCFIEENEPTQYEQMSLF